MMILRRVEPAGRGHERLNYECRECGQAESYTMAIDK
jgi:hypothetical protein